MTLPLLKAIRKKDLLQVEILLAEGADPDLPCLFTDESPLCAAFDQENNIKIIKRLIEYDADINQQNKYGEAAIHVASQQGSPEPLTYLLEQKGVDVNLVSDFYGNALHCTFLTNIEDPAYKGYPTVNIQAFKILLSNGVNPHVLHDGISLMCKAAYCGEFEVVQLLHQNEVRIDGALPYLLYAENPSFDIAELLVTAGADLSQTEMNISDPMAGFGETIRVIAAISCDVELLEYIFDISQNLPVINDPGEYDWPPIFSAVLFNESAAVLDFLIERGADVDYKCSETGKSLLHFCMTSLNREASPRIVANIKAKANVLLQYLDVDTEDDTGQTPLYHILDEWSHHPHCLELMGFLLDAGADPFHRGYDCDYCPAYLAKIRNHDEAEKLLFSYRNGRQV